MILRQRKRNRLSDYDYSSKGAYFVTVCTKKREEMLSAVIEGDTLGTTQLQLSCYGEIAEKYLKAMNGMDTYVIMPNHIHIIVVVQDQSDGPMWASAPTQSRQSLSQRIKSFKTLVTKEIGFSLFQRSFYDHIIRNQEEYNRIWQYIDSNPQKWREDCFYQGAQGNDGGLFAETL